MASCTDLPLIFFFQTTAALIIAVYKLCLCDIQLIPADAPAMPVYGAFLIMPIFSHPQFFTLPRLSCLVLHKISFQQSHRHFHTIYPFLRSFVRSVTVSFPKRLPLRSSPRVIWISPFVFICKGSRLRDFSLWPLPVCYFFKL